MPRIVDLEVRFNEKVDKSGGVDACWLWTATTDADGYGKFWFDGNMMAASRVAWIIEHGEIPPGMEVLHNCPGGDNPACVNPKHLFLGTKKTNMDDRGAKGRTACGDNSARRLHPESYEHLKGEGWHATHQNQVSGENHHEAKVTWADVRAMRRAYLDSGGKTSQSALAKKYDLTQAHVSDILSNKVWTEPEGDVRALVVEKKQKRNAAIVIDLLAGMTRVDIAAKHGVSRQVVADAWADHQKG